MRKLYIDMSGKLYLYNMEMLNTTQATLLQIKPDLVSKYHISTIGLLGSIVRYDFTNDSDIDIVVDFNQPLGIGFIDLANELEAILKRKVDLVSKKGLSPNTCVS